jgi:hypothetical protein
VTLRASLFDVVHLWVLWCCGLQRAVWLNVAACAGGECSSGEFSSADRFARLFRHASVFRFHASSAVRGSRHSKARRYRRHLAVVIKRQQQISECSTSTFSVSLPPPPPLAPSARPPPPTPSLAPFPDPRPSAPQAKQFCAPKRRLRQIGQPPY